MNFVSLSVPAGSTHRFAVEEIARTARRPIPIQSLCEELSDRKLIRGGTFFGLAGDGFDQIARNYDDMQWWVSDEGLNVAILPQDMEVLSPCDDLAGSVAVELWGDGLSLEALSSIAKAIDQAGFTLQEQLEPAQWKPISDHNRRIARSAIKTFSQAAGDKRFVRSVRKRLYRARERYLQALLRKQHARLLD